MKKMTLLAVAGMLLSSCASQPQYIEPPQAATSHHAAEDSDHTV